MVLPDQKVTKAIQAQRAHREPPVLRALRAIPVLQEPLELRDPKGKPAMPM